MTRPSPARPASPDVIVVGGGVIGLAIAEELARRERRVELFDRRRPGGEASWAAGGMLAAEYEFEAPGPLQQLAFHSRALWPDYAERLFAEYAADVRLRREGTLLPALEEPALARLHARLDGRPFGGRVEWLDGAAARAREPALAVGLAGAAWLRDDLACDNRALLFALLRALRKLGVTIHAGAPVSIRTEGGAVRGVLVNGERRDAGLVVNAAGAWASGVVHAPRPPAAHPRLFPVRGQMLGLRAGSAGALRHVVRWEGGYAVPRGDGRIVVGSTMEPEAGFAKGVVPDALARLEAGMRRVLPGLEAERRHAWSGLRPATEDGLPVLGALPGLDGYLLAAGHLRNGILLAPATAAAIADLVTGATPATDLSPFSPARPSLAAAPSIIVNGAPRRLVPGTSVGALLAELSLRRPGVAVALNAEVVRRSEWDRTLLSGDDRVEIIHAVGGG